MGEWRYNSRSPEETRRLAAALGTWLAPGDIIALTGELGSGKTEFVHGLAAGLGVPSQTPVASPSFTLAHEYPGRLALTHLDLYRLENLSPEMLPDLEEYLHGGRVAVVEWAERAASLLPADHLEVRLTITGSQERELTFVSHGPRSEDLVDLLRHRENRKRRTGVIKWPSSNPDAPSRCKSRKKS
ncbi:MAG: tRNA (adenosine(37)-N6)-threonylcarbamoyltransferase complex ATPase subunit type 1 TsaE [Deltaproteobacteria bacterium]|nr:tRNA (adenosine(37)-N6)-threonylcarbamoyltransferase complex ATPase subunit type 1 TsaE [Deltaproteobacteria bacterium]